MKKLTVNSSKKYEVIIENNILANVGSSISSVLPAPRKLCIVTDENVAALYLGQVSDSLASPGFQTYAFEIKAGEASKCMTVLSSLLEFLATSGLTRNDAIVALGGGVVGDLAGFAAAAYLRGIPFIQIPTTLLSAIDSSVGGKTGVNLGSGKNLAGAFWQPSLVICDPLVLKTLPYEVFLEGLGEAIKYGVLFDEDLFALFENTNPKKLWTESFLGLEEIIYQCVLAKARVVEADEFDTGERQLLNLGHTLGHSLEKLSDYRIHHGIAVALGMAVIAKCGVSMGLTSESSMSRICRLILAYGFYQNIDFQPELGCFEPITGFGYSAQDLALAAGNDKKRSGSELTLIIPIDIGNCILHKIPADALVDILQAGLSN